MVKMEFIFVTLRLFAVRLLCELGSTATITREAIVSRMLIWTSENPELLSPDFCIGKRTKCVDLCQCFESRDPFG